MDDKSSFDNGKPIKIEKNILCNNSVNNNESNNLDISNSYSIDVSKKNNSVLMKDIKIIKNNRLLNYLNNIKPNLKKEIFSKIKLKELSSKSRVSESLPTYDISVSNSMSLNKPKIISSKLRNIKVYNNPDYIKLNSLFRLPPITNKNRRNLKTLIISKNNSPGNNNNSSFLTDIKPKRILLSPLKRLHKRRGENTVEDKKDHRHDNIYNFMKLKYYEDVNEKYEKKLRDDSFIDRGVKDKIIKIEKVGIFWKNVFEYCGAFIFAEKFRKLRKPIRKDDDSYNINRRKINKTPKKIIYTSLICNKIIHSQNKEKI